MIDKYKKIFLKSYYLINFNFIKQDEVIKKCLDFLESVCFDKNIKNDFEKYNLFLLALENQKEKDFSKYFKNLILNKQLNPEYKSELEILNEISKINSSEIKQILIEKYQNDFNFFELFENFPEFKNSFEDFSFEEFNQEKNYKNFEELYKDNSAFVFDNDFNIIPIEIKQQITFENLKGYKEQQRAIYNNTKALLQGKKVNNILLYGDAGCGKSSTIKALLGEFSELKIIQIFKNNLINLDRLYKKLENLPYKFIIYADDISFDDTDNTLSTMKAVLEGSLIQCPQNAVIYATSNRRHLVKESFKSRQGDEIHLHDTINEINSLSERFGITLLFSKPTNEEFKQILLQLAKDRNINIEENILFQKANRLALIKGSNSPRVICQMLDNLENNIEI